MLGEVGVGSTDKGNSQDTLVDGNLNRPSSMVSVDNGSSCYPNCKDAVGDTCAPSSEGSNPEYASCTVVVEQSRLSRDRCESLASDGFLT